MLSVRGRSGKSIIADAIKKYNNARVYSYDTNIILSLESYHVNTDECDVEEFCKFVFKDIHNLGTDMLPLNMVVIYTNLSDIDDIGLLEDYAHTLEQNHMAATVVIMHK